MATKKTEKKATKAKKKPVSLEVRVNESVFKTEAETLVEALTAFTQSPEFPFGVKTSVVLKHTDGKLSGIRTIPVTRARVILRKIVAIPSELEFLAEKMRQELN